MNVFEVGNVIDDQEIPNGRFDLLVNTWLPNHLDSTGATAILEFNHPAQCKTTCEPLAYGHDDFPTTADWVKNMDAVVRLIETETSRSGSPSLSATLGLTGRTSLPAPSGRRNPFRIVVPICNGVAVKSNDL